MQYVSGTGLGAFTVYVKNDGSPGNNPTSFYIEIPAGSVSGAQNYAQLTFKALAAGAANIVFFDDDGGNSGWPDFNTFEPIVATYNQAERYRAGAGGPGSGRSLALRERPGRPRHPEAQATGLKPEPAQRNR